jgi:hypothetical protein
MLEMTSCSLKTIDIMIGYILRKLILGNSKYFETFNQLFVIKIPGKFKLVHILGS